MPDPEIERIRDELAAMDEEDLRVRASPGLREPGNVPSYRVSGVRAARNAPRALAPQ